MRIISTITAFVLVVSTSFGAENAIEFERGEKEVDGKFVVRDIPQSLVQSADRWTDEAWQKLFTVSTVIDGKLAPAPILGDYSAVNGKLTFQPRYPLRRGVTYRATLRLRDSGGKETPITGEFVLAEKPTPPTNLTAIYPTRDVVPENLLKFYFHFSAPMSRGEVYSRVRLRDQNGKLVAAPFLELSEELWSPDGMRLTLYFDPGRIKRGLQPRELFGPSLIEGGSYTLEIDKNWPDAEGRPLAGSERVAKKSFRVTAPDDGQPAVKRWKVTAPTAGGREPLTVVFDEPLDSAMLVRVLEVRDQSGSTVPGNVELGKEELRWSFRPESNWVPGAYKLTTATSLEDLAGNSLRRPFEVDIFRPAKHEPEKETTSIGFVVR